MRMCVYIDRSIYICIHIPTAILISIVKIENQPICSMVDELIKKMSCLFIYNIIYQYKIIIFVSWGNRDGAQYCPFYSSDF